MKHATNRQWPAVPLGEIILDARSGFASGEDIPAGIVQVRMNNVTREGNFEWDKVRRVPPPKRGIDGLLIEPGDVLFNATNSPELVGKSAAFDRFPEPVTFSNHFIRLRPNREIVDSKWIAGWLVTQWLRGVFAGMCRQWVNQASISREQLLGLRIPLPPLAEQRRIADILDQARELRRNRRRALERLNTLTRAVFLEMFGDPVLNVRQWSTQNLGEVGDLERGVSKHRPRNDPVLLNGPYPLIQTGDIANCDGYIREYTSSYSEVGLRQSRLWPKDT